MPPGAPKVSATSCFQRKSQDVTRRRCDGRSTNGAVTNQGQVENRYARQGRHGNDTPRSATQTTVRNHGNGRQTVVHPYWGVFDVAPGTDGPVSIDAVGNTLRSIFFRLVVSQRGSTVDGVECDGANPARRPRSVSRWPGAVQLAVTVLRVGYPTLHLSVSLPLREASTTTTALPAPCMEFSTVFLPGGSGRCTAPLAGVAGAGRTGGYHCCYTVEGPCQQSGRG